MEKSPEKRGKLRKNVPVVELDTIKASDAFGPGSSPGGHTKKRLAVGQAFFRAPAALG